MTPLLTRAGPTYPVAPVLSMYDPVFIGIDEFGRPVYARSIYRNLLAAGEPGGGKSGLLNTFAAHAALAAKSRLVLFDGKEVELGFWADIADEFVGPDLNHAIITLRRLQQVMNNHYAWLRAGNRRKITDADDITVITSIFDEIALYSATLGTEQQQREFTAGTGIAPHAAGRRLGHQRDLPTSAALWPWSSRCHRDERHRQDRQAQLVRPVLATGRK